MAPKATAAGRSSSSSSSSKPTSSQKDAQKGVFEALVGCSTDLDEAQNSIEALLAASQRVTDDLRAELARLREENESLRSQVEGLSLKRESTRAPSIRGASFRTDGDFADEVWGPLEELLERAKLKDPAQLPLCDIPDDNSKFVTDVRHFEFGDTKDFLGGLSGLTGGAALGRSMEEECRMNEGGIWWQEYEYVVHFEAQENVPLDSSIFIGTRSIAGVEIVRDRGHAGMKLADFCAQPSAVQAELTSAEVAALRLYSGPLYVPLNRALRKQQVAEWATTISCCYSGVLKLSFLSSPTRVYRGVRETEMRLPPEFMQTESGAGFAGGVERAFMSTSTSPAVALDYSGGKDHAGAIFIIDFDMTSRGASIQWLSQYPHEEELLFPPCTGLTSCGVVERHNKRCLLLSAQVSTARPDTRDILTPEYVPGTADALQWIAELKGYTTAAALAQRAHWDLSEKNVAAHAGRLGLLVGRASRVAAPVLKSLDLSHCQLTANCAEQLAEALESEWCMLQKLTLTGNDLGPEGGLAVAAAMRANRQLTHLDLGDCYLGPALCRCVLTLCSTNTTLRTLMLDDNRCNISSDELVSGLCANTTLTSLSLSNNAFGGADVARALAGNGGLTRLCVSKCALGDDGAVAVGEALHTNETLRELVLDSNGIKDDGAKAIATALTVNPTLAELSMRANKMGPKAGKALAEALLANSTLVKLDVAKNALGDWAKNLLKKGAERSNVGGGGGPSPSPNPRAGLQRSNTRKFEMPADGDSLAEASAVKGPERVQIQIVM